jgi:CHU_C Type IX secretion signal domain
MTQFGRNKVFKGSLIPGILFLVTTLAGNFSFAQVVITSGTNVALSGNPEILFRTSQDFVNQSTQDFTNSQLTLILNGPNQTISGSIIPFQIGLTTPGDQIVNASGLTCSRLAIAGGGKKNLNTNLTVNSELHLINGIVFPLNSSKLLFSGSSEGIVDAGPDSYVDGIFYNNGTGLLNFPIGAAGLGFAPVQVETGSGQEIGIQAMSGSAGLTPAASDVEIIYIENAYYWQLHFDPGQFNSRIRLPFKSTVPETASPVVVSSDATGSQAFNLGSFSVDEKSVTSLSPFTESIVTIGGSTTVQIRVHDMLTPFNHDTFNDELFIENIAKFPSNKVTLLDRWGVVVKEWTNYTNYNDPLTPNQEPFNFGSLSPGNYICVVEYGEEGQPQQKLSQMVTVLKTD